MRILANENIPREAVDALGQRGHDVVWARIQSPGAKDEAILSRAQAEDRVVLTFDKDFGELAFRRSLPASAGIILLRIAKPGPTETVARIVSAIQSRPDWTGHFSVIENDRIRMTQLRHT